MLPNFRERAQPKRQCFCLPRGKGGLRMWLFCCAFFLSLYFVFVIFRLNPSATPSDELRPIINKVQQDARGHESLNRSRDDKPSSSTLREKKDPYSIKIPHIRSTVASSPDVVDKRNRIRKAFQFAYNGYEKQCLGNGELKPVSGKCKNWLADKMGLTIIDSLDTMLIMGLDDEYKRGRDYLKQHLDWDKNISVLVFEMNIRCLGGLLSAYLITEDEFYLEKAQDLGERLLPAFQTPTGIPRTSVNLKTGTSHSPKWSQGNSILADVGSLQLEFAALSRFTKEPKYNAKALGVFNLLRQKQPADKLYPTFINPDSVLYVALISIGALGDSFYEYLLKYWLLTNKKASEIGEWYFETADAVKDILAAKYGMDMVYVRMRQSSNSFDDQMDHLACYAGAMFALGSTQMSDSSHATAHLATGKGIARFCYEMYRFNPSGLPCDSYRVDTRSNRITPVQSALAYVQRPEAVESWFYLHRITKEPMYREWGWAFFEAIEKTKTEFGYSGVRDSRQSSDAFEFDDEQQSFFLAETLKYLYLLFSEDDVLPLDEFVFNTEAHPLKIFSS